MSAEPVQAYGRWAGMLSGRRPLASTRCSRVAPIVTSDKGAVPVSSSPSDTLSRMMLCAVRQWILWLLIGLAGLGLILLILWAVVVVPPRLIDVHEIQDPAKRLDDVNSFRTTLAGVLGGLAVIAGAIVGALNFRETQRQNRAVQKENQEVLELQRRGQVTERFTRAIEQLGQRGDDKLDVRLGAIYALEQIAWDSTELHWPIMEVLTAYLREHGSPKDQPFNPRLPIDMPYDPRFRIPSDHQAIATVIGRRRAERDPADQRLNLRAVDLRAANVRGADLRGAHLFESLLSCGRISRGPCSLMSSAAFWKVSWATTRLLIRRRPSQNQRRTRRTLICASGWPPRSKSFTDTWPLCDWHQRALPYHHLTSTPPWLALSTTRIRIRSGSARTLPKTPTWCFENIATTR
jgi:hypothetical protein